MSANQYEADDARITAALEHLTAERELRDRIAADIEALTPPYYVQEAWGHGFQRAITLAAEVVRGGGRA